MICTLATLTVEREEQMCKTHRSSFFRRIFRQFSVSYVYVQIRYDCENIGVVSLGGCMEVMAFPLDY